MGRYRYRTCVLVGPWRDAVQEAARDAIRSGQARLDRSGAGLSWSVPGTIEQEDEEVTGHDCRLAPE